MKVQSTITWYAADGGTDGNPATGDNPTQASLTLVQVQRLCFC
jgi:hypothetical protein